MRRVAVIGVGVTKFGRHERTSAELFAEAAADALADAGLPATAVQALYYGNVVGGETERQLHTSPQAASVLGVTLHAAALGTGTGGCKRQRQNGPA